MPPSFSLTCAIHPDRAGVALCVLCRRTVCAECTTRFQGINHCSACVPRLALPEAPARRGRSPALEGVSVVVAYAGVAGLFYALAVLVAP